MVTVTEEQITPYDARRIADESTFVRGYDATEYWTEAYTQGHYIAPRDVVLGDTPVVDVARVPLVFLSDGQLYEGKNRIVSLAESGVDCAFTFLVIRGWNRRKWPLPMAGEHGWEDGVMDVWWHFHRICYRITNTYYRQDGDKMKFRREEF
jgi:hypothetical protein